MRSKVVTLQELGERVVQLTLHDRDSKNSFSAAMIADLIEAFATIRRHERYRVVLLTGYESYFCSGGTKDGLLSLLRGKNADILNAIRDSRDLSDDTAAKLKSVVEGFAKTFA